MTCPEELLERWPALDAEERRALERHAMTCEACRLETSIAPLVEVAARDVDRARVERAASAAVGAQQLVMIAARRRPVKLYALLAAAALLVAGLAAAAIAQRRHAEPPPPRSPHATAVEARTIAAVANEPAAIVAPPTVSIEDLPVARTAEVAQERPRSETAAELFARGNRARQEGKPDDAVDAYRALEQRFPTSHEAGIAHVSLGRLLERRGDAAGALAEFDTYLAGASGADLREEALVGRARACSKLGRSDEEKRAWETLLHDYPDSLNAAHARERLDAIR
jgi:TolA-binding protein